jgi:hypothetical protein
MSLSNWTHWLRPMPPIVAPFFAAPDTLNLRYMIIADAETRWRVPALS